MTEQTKIELIAQQVIPDTSDINVAYVAAALEITKLASHSIIYDKTTPEEKAKRLAQLFVIAKKEMLAQGIGTAGR